MLEILNLCFLCLLFVVCEQFGGTEHVSEVYFLMQAFFSVKNKYTI